MKLFIPSLVVCLGISALAAPPPARPAQTSQPAQDPQATALLLQAVAALTGGATLSDVTLTGTATRFAGIENDSGPATLKALATGQSRMTLNLSSGPLSETRANASDGTPAGIWSGADGVVHAVLDHNLWTTSTWFFPAFTLSPAASTGDFVASYVGQELRNGAAVQHITIFQQISGTKSAVASVQRLSQTEVYLAANTLLPAVITYNAHPDQSSAVDIPVEIRFSNFQSVNRAQVPFHVQKWVQNSLVLDIQIQSAVFNSGLTTAAFPLQ